LTNWHNAIWGGVSTIGCAAYTIAMLPMGLFGTDLYLPYLLMSTHPHCHCHFAFLRSSCQLSCSGALSTKLSSHVYWCLKEHWLLCSW